MILSLCQERGKSIRADVQVASRLRGGKMQVCLPASGL